MLKKFVYVSFIFGVLMIAIVAGVYAYVSGYSSKFIYSDIDSVPRKRAALVLGTSKYLAKNKINDFYRYRIDSAYELWRKGKVDAIVVSGDNQTRYYNETAQMYKDLRKRGISGKYIARDYAGFRTLDSVMRAGIDFGLKDYIIVSQGFHLERAVYIAHAKGQTAIGFVAKGKGVSFASVKMIIREALARIKMLLDLYIFDTKPKFYGGKMKVNYKNPIPQ